MAIDGPAGAGKSTVAKRVAQVLGYVYIDTGAMYRALTLKAMRLGIDCNDTAALGALAAQTVIRLVLDEQESRVLVDGRDVSREIREPEVSRRVSAVAAVPAVRQRLVELQRELARDGGVVMDGRDIGSHVLPAADRKFFVTGSLEQRAQRRRKDLEMSGHSVAIETVMAEVAERDRQDATRETNPLKAAPDSIYIDTTGLSVEQVVNRILEFCQ